MIDSELVLVGLYIGIVVLISLLILLIPLKTLSAVTKPFSFKTFGIRKIRRWNNRTDTLGNFFIWISLLFCLLFPFIPYAPLVYGLWLTFTWLCTVSRAVRLSKAHSLSRKLAVIFMINLLYGTALLAGLGILDGFALWTRSEIWAQDMISGKGIQIMYFLQSPNAFCYGTQMLLMFIPLMTLWGQFKYMRLENTFKSRNIFLYVLKYTILVLLLIGTGTFGIRFIEDVYHVSGEDQLGGSLNLFSIFESK